MCVAGSYLVLLQGSGLDYACDRNCVLFSQQFRAWSN